MTDTTMGGGRGGVGIRLFVQGGEVVKRAFGQVADSGKKMWAEIAMGERAANPALRSMSRLSGDAQAAMGGLANRAGAAGNALSAFGWAGVAAGAALGAIALAAAGAVAGMNDAMKAAADLTDTSERIGIGVEALQRWNYVADESGVEVATLQANMEKLNGALGAFKLGIGDGRIKPIFEELGISNAQLDNVRNAEDLMMMLADTLGQVEDRATQVRLARGLGIEESLPILRLGSEGIRELYGEAEQLGFVLREDVVKELDESERALERAGQQMRVIRDTAVAPLADAFASAATYVAGLASEFANIESHAPKWMQTLMSLGRLLPGSGQAQRLGEFIAARIAPNAPARGASTYQSVTVEDMEELLRPPRRSGFTPQGHTAGRTRGGGAARNTAERDAERRQREQDRLREQLARMETTAERNWFQTMYGPGGPRESRLELALAQVAMDREAWAAQRDALAAELEKAGLLDEANKARLEELDALHVEASRARDAAALREEERELAARRLEAERAGDEHAIDLLAIDEQLATNARDRSAIARRILELQQALERKLLAADLDADETLSPEERARRLGMSDDRHRRELGLFDHQERERMREDFRSYGREVVDAIEAGRIGEHIGNELKAKLIDMALDGVFDLLNPGSGGKGGGSLWDMGARLVGSLFGLGPGRAGGGDLWKGYRHPVVETGRPELLLIGGQGQVTGAEETARLLREMAGSGGANGGRMAGRDTDGFEVTVLAGDGLKAEVRRVSREEARSAAATAGARSYRASVSAAPQAVADRRAYRE